MAMDLERWLADHGAADLPHPGGTLLAHLRRTAAALEDWGADPSLRTVALMHATYGTDWFGPALLPLGDRDVVRALVGDEAEAEVHRYATCDRSATYPRLVAGEGVVVSRLDGAVEEIDRTTVERFLELTAANELDVLAHGDDYREQHADDLLAWLRAFAPWLSEGANGAVETFAERVALR